ncbi:hypothetical protein LFX25_03430 [Leptospira sp. FAT2]|uniref:hypothetical protein n=1 Tax=Leptospira sanjuanensis TaxID=2879643 RepID=UPI001EE9A747|nr:hypothetical protein [Leptospira sanjuanensis]MCG6192291.1 hypothetical protein [Leptospira sanjuanensis]
MAKTEKNIKPKATFKFTANDFYELLEKYDRKCALTGRILTPLTAEIELREPFKKVGISEKENHYLVDKTISYLARHISEEEIIEIAAEIIRFRGFEKGYSVSEKKMKKVRS